MKLAKIDSGGDGGPKDLSGSSETRAIDQQDGQRNRSHKGLSVYMAAIFLVAEMAGAGILNLPYATANTGWVGVPLLIGLVVAVGYSGTRLALCWVMLEERWPEYRTPCWRPYPTIAYRALGKPGWYVTEVALDVTLFGACSAYLLLIADTIDQLLSSFNTGMTTCEWVIIVGCLITLPSWLGTPKDMWPASILAMVSTLVACVVVIIESIVERDSHPDPKYTAPTFSSFFLGFASILFSLGGASIFPTIQNDMKNRTEFPSSVIIAFLVLLAAYAPLATITYGVFGDAVQANILMSVSGVAVTIANTLILCHFTFASIILINPVMQTMEGILKIPTHFSVWRCIVRTGVMCVVMLMCLAVPSFSKILDLIGGSTVALLSFIMPPICYYRLRTAQDPALDLPYRKLSWKEIVPLACIVLIGTVGGVASTFSAFKEILSPEAFSKSCFHRTTFL